MLKIIILCGLSFRKFCTGRNWYACMHWTRRWQRTWIQGWYYNPIYPGSYAYALWKEELPREDMNEDGKVDILDIARAARAFGAFFEPGWVHPRWDSKADINQNQDINIIDISQIARYFGYYAGPWTPP